MMSSLKFQQLDSKLHSDDGRLDLANALISLYFKMMSLKSSESATRVEARA